MPRLAYLLMGLILTTAAAAQGNEQTTDFDIPPGPLPEVLAAFGQQASLQVSYDPALAAGKRSSGASGEFSPRAALQRLLAGSGVSYRFTDTSTVTLVRAPTSGEQTLAPLTVEGSRPESAYGPVEGYNATRSATATKTDTAIIDTPGSIQVVPREVIEDQDAQRISDVLENVSGVQNAGTFGNRNDVFTVRGFQPIREGSRTTVEPLTEE